MARVRVRYDDRQLNTRVEQYKREFQEMLSVLIDYHAAAGVVDMKTNAPWTDRTSAARNGLFSVTEHGGNHYTIVLSHTVYYGFWLEVKFSGRDAIIMPTVISRGRALMSDIEKRLK